MKRSLWNLLLVISPPPQHIIVFLPVKNRKTTTNQGGNEVVITDVEGSLSRTSADADMDGSVVEALGLNPSPAPCSLGPGLCLVKLQ